MNIAFDDQGTALGHRAPSSIPYPAKDGTTPRDTVKILEDFEPDGQAGKISTFADGLNIPIGVLPLPEEHEALVHASRRSTATRDTDGDGRADRRARSTANSATKTPTG